eukprot:Blabericola_migrator_1__3148@NODE_191_length_11624_cov_142_842866_g68_i1_p5_GENE_NODE_191_length_11624_cov_142_842866_g68_i1NODE_191_length_11624_cov_142_842866_g68_i1_p5_ORF_typecomplete_len308_score53_20MgtE/PF01769_16/1_9e03MgtE/PF01769_16/1_9e10_NODE_191_length_11624_cov_142_842866_g68_i112422165
MREPYPSCATRSTNYDEVGLERRVNVEASPFGQSSCQIVPRRAFASNRICSAPQIIPPCCSKISRPQSLQSETVEVVQFTSHDDLYSPPETVFRPESPINNGGSTSLLTAAGEPQESLAKFSHRFAWLVALLMLQSLSSFILKRFEDVFIEHSIVVLFLTMLVGAGGNAGSQSTVLAIRGIVKGQFPYGRSVSDFVMTELIIGVKLAMILALVSFVRVWLFDADLWEVLAICVSMFGIVFVSVVIGTMMPLCLWHCGFDAAHAGAAIQVTIDIVGVTITCVLSSLIFGLAAKSSKPYMRGGEITAIE